MLTSSFLKPYIFFFCIIMLASSIDVKAQNDIDSLKKKIDSLEAQIADMTSEQKLEETRLSESNTKTGYGILVFGGVVVVFLLYSMIKSEKFFGPNFTKIIGVTVILTFSIFLVTVEADGPLVTSIVALIGTLGGYLFGKSDDFDSLNDKESKIDKEAREAREAQGLAGTAGTVGAG